MGIPLPSQIIALLNSYNELMAVWNGDSVKSVTAVWNNELMAVWTSLAIIRILFLSVCRRLACRKPSWRIGQSLQKPNVPQAFVIKMWFATVNCENNYHKLTAVWNGDLDDKSSSQNEIIEQPALAQLAEKSSWRMDQRCHYCSNQMHNQHSSWKCDLPLPSIVKQLPWSWTDGCVKWWLR